MMTSYIVNVISTCLSLVSLIFTSLALLICITQQSWKKRDGVLLFNIFLIDVLFSCIVATTNIKMIECETSMSVGNIVLSNLFVFIFLTSWASQCLIAINRYIVIIFPFAYKKILNRIALCSLVAITWILMITGCILSITLHSKSTFNIPVHHGGVAYQFVLMNLADNAIATIMAFHLLFLVVIFLMECYLWKIARGHQNRYRSIKLSVKSKQENTNGAPGKPNLENKRQSITQTLQKRLSFSTPKMAVRRTPFLLLGAHFSTIIPYCLVGITYAVSPEIDSKSNRYLCLFLLVANSLRPIINVFHHISSNKMKRFKLLLRVFITKKTELGTEYYIENHKEVETLFKLRRESAHSIVTEGSVV